MDNSYMDGMPVNVEFDPQNKMLDAGVSKLTTDTVVSTNRRKLRES
jgi:hypothetical protein